MPSVRIPIVSLGYDEVVGARCGADGYDPDDLIVRTTRPNQYAVVGKTRLKIGPDEVILTTTGQLFVLEGSMDGYLPENTTATSFSLNFYVTHAGQSSYTGSLENERRTISVKTGWNKLTFTPNNRAFNDIELQLTAKEFMDTINDCTAIYRWSESNPNGSITYGSHTFEWPSGYEMNSRNIWFWGEQGTYKPYVELFYEHNPPVAPTSLAPDNSTENPRTPIRFTWNSRIDQQAFRLQYRVNGGNWVTVQRTTEDRFYEMPEATILETEGTVNWRVQVAEAHMVYSSYENASFQLGVLPNKPPALNYPVGDYIKNARTVNFSWVFIPNTIEKQVEYELQYKIENDVWKTVKEVTDRENVDIPLNIDESKVVEWRLRVKNQFDEWTDWTDTVRFQVIGSPPAPQITNVTNANNPTIFWQSRDQEMFEIVILDKDDNIVYESGKIVGVGTRSHKVPVDIKNGKYLIKLTTYNIYNVESPTTEYTHIINPEPITAPDISLFESRFSVLIRSNVTDGTVIRDGKVLGQLKDGEFEDFSGVNKKVYNYSIRTKENDIFADSEIKSARVDFAHHNTLALLDNLKDFMLLSYDLEGDPQRSVALKVESEFIPLDGIKHSTVELGEHEEETKSFSCFIEKKSDLDKLIELVQSKEIVLLRDTRENNFEGFIQSLNYTYHTFGYQISFMLNRTGDFYD